MVNGDVLLNDAPAAIDAENAEKAIDAENAENAVAVKIKKRTTERTGR
jgi:hypothetical protein